MSTSISAIQAMRRELGLDEATYRGLLDRVTGKASLTLMSETELQRVAADLRSKGAGQARKLAGPYAGKLQALWISGWHLGVVRNRNDAALLAFVKARTGIEHTRFLRDAKDARKAVEALKQWLARDAGVDWNEFEDPLDCVLAAQRRLLRAGPAEMAVTPMSAATSDGVRTVGKLALTAVFGKSIRARKAGV